MNITDCVDRAFILATGMSARRGIGSIILKDISLLVLGLSLYTASASAAESKDAKASGIGASADWRTVEITEAFPGSLADLDTPSAVSGGASGMGTANKGNFAINAKGQMAITFVQGIDAAADLVIGRSGDGKAWARHHIRDVDMRNSSVVGRLAVLTYVYTGPGPQAQIDEAGNVCVACLRGDELDTLLWPANEAQLRPADRIRGDLPVERCSGIKLDRQIGWFHLYHHEGRFYLVTIPDSAFSDFVRVYEMWDKKWQLLGKPLSADRGMLAFDDVNGDLYLGVRTSRRNANGKFPAVFRWDKERKAWQELTSPAPGLREEFGITTYPGGGCPVIVAHGGKVWAFWWQESALMLQGAVYADGKWQSCAKTTMTEWRQQEGDVRVEHESFGQGHGLFHTDIAHFAQREWMDAFFDPSTGDIVLFASDCQLGLVLRSGHSYPIEWRRRVEASGTIRYAPGLVTGVGEGFDNLVTTGAIMPHTVHSVYANGSLYLHATLNKGGNTSASDVFVYKFSPLPYRDLGLELSDSETGRAIYRVVKTIPGGLGERAGIRAEDLIHWVGKEMPPEETDPHRALRRAIRFAPSGRLSIRIERAGEQMTVQIQIPE